MADNRLATPKIYIEDKDIDFDAKIEDVFIVVNLDEKSPHKLESGVYAKVSFTSINDKLKSLLDNESDYLFYDLKYLINIKTEPDNMSLPCLNDKISDIFQGQFEKQWGLPAHEVINLFEDLEPEELALLYRKENGKRKDRQIRITITIVIINYLRQRVRVRVRSR